MKKCEECGTYSLCEAVGLDGDVCESYHKAENKEMEEVNLPKHKIKILWNSEDDVNLDLDTMNITITRQTEKE